VARPPVVRVALRVLRLQLEQAAPALHQGVAHGLRARPALLEAPAPVPPWMADALRQARLPRCSTSRPPSCCATKGRAAWSASSGLSAGRRPRRGGSSAPARSRPVVTEPHDNIDVAGAGCLQADLANRFVGGRRSARRLRAGGRCASPCGPSCCCSLPRPAVCELMGADACLPHHEARTPSAHGSGDGPLLPPRRTRCGRCAPWPSTPSPTSTPSRSGRSRACCARWASRWPPSRPSPARALARQARPLPRARATPPCCARSPPPRGAPPWRLAGRAPSAVTTGFKAALPILAAPVAGRDLLSLTWETGGTWPRDIARLVHVARRRAGHRRLAQARRGVRRERRPPSGDRGLPPPCLAGQAAPRASRGRRRPTTCTGAGRPPPRAHAHGARELAGDVARAA
jgi:hypothetical protein